jgi:O-antigen ligase
MMFRELRTKNVFWLATASVAAVSIVVITAFEKGYILPLLLLGAGYMVWSFPRPLVALTTIVLLHAHLVEQSEGISILEYGFAAYTYGYLVYWFCSKAFVRRSPIVLGGLELFLLGFLAMAVLSLGMLVVEREPVEWWLREVVVVGELLLYFPARDVLTTERAIRSVFGALVLVAAGIAIVNLVEYRASTLAANYLWQLWGGRQVFGGSLFFGSSVLLSSWYIHHRGYGQRLLVGIGFAATALALSFTFSRGFWIGGMLGILTIFFLLEAQRRYQLILTSALGIVVLATVIQLMAGDVGQTVLRALAIRLSTSTDVARDISLSNRLAESRAALEAVRESPIVGHGYGASFLHYNLINEITERSIYVHDSYVYMLLKVGILGFVLFFGFLLGVLREGFRLGKRVKMGVSTTAMIRGTVGVFVGILFIATNSGNLTDKSVILMIALGAGAIMAVSRSQPVGRKAG